VVFSFFFFFFQPLDPGRCRHHTLISLSYHVRCMIVVFFLGLVKS
jgi:hypothetical protein